MFDFAGSEIAVLGVVALVLIGPKEMPVAIRTLARVLKKVRRVAGEFQHHVDQMMHEADLDDVQATFRDLGSMSLKQIVADAVDHDGSLSRAFDEPLVQHGMPPTAPAPDASMPPFVPPMFGQAAFAPAGR